MAEEETEQPAAQRGGLIPKLVIWGVVFVLGVGTGVSVPLLLMSPMRKCCQCARSIRLGADGYSRAG